MMSQNAISQDSLRPDLCIIGRGSAAMAVALAARFSSVPTVVIDQNEHAGDDLAAGGLASLALKAAAEKAWRCRHDLRSGTLTGFSSPDRAGIARDIAALLAEKALTRSPARLAGLGIQVLTQKARFIDNRRLLVGEVEITPRRTILATGSMVGHPNIPGLVDVPFLTGDTIFNIQETPRRLVILGGGAFALEMAQAHRRLGSEVTIVAPGLVLEQEDPDLVAVLSECLGREGIRILTHTTVSLISRASHGMTLDVDHDGRKDILTASHLLLATPRVAAVEGLNLSAAGIECEERGIRVDRHLRTDNRTVYAVGDCAQGPQTPSAAEYQAGLAFNHAVFRRSSRVDYAVVPRTIFCDPEFAAIGLTEAEAARQSQAPFILRYPFSQNERATSEGHKDGLVKILADQRGKILGVGIVGRQAGDLLTPWTLALAKGMTVMDIADLPMINPGYSQISRMAALQLLRQKAGNPYLGRFIRFIRVFG